MAARRRFSRRVSALLLVLSVLGALLATAASAPASVAAAAAAPPAERPAILFAADGMRPDLVDRFAARGTCPTCAS